MFAGGCKKVRKSAQSNRLLPSLPLLADADISENPNTLTFWVQEWRYIEKLEYDYIFFLQIYELQSWVYYLFRIHLWQSMSAFYFCHRIQVHLLIGRYRHISPGHCMSPDGTKYFDLILPYC